MDAITDAVRSNRAGGKTKQDVIYLGEHTSAQEALESWPQEILELKRIGSPKQAQKLQEKLNMLRSLTREDEQSA